MSVETFLYALAQVTAPYPIIRGQFVKIHRDQICGVCPLTALALGQKLITEREITIFGNGGSLRDPVLNRLQSHFDIPVLVAKASYRRWDYSSLATPLELAADLRVYLFGTQ